MAEIGNERKKRNIRRLVIILVIALIAGSVFVYNKFFNEELPEVRTAVLDYGDLTSKMYVTAEIQPGNTVNHSLKQAQKVLKVFVEPGDQVDAGDVLLTLDMTELEKQYQQAQETRLGIEQGLTEEEQAAAARKAENEQARANVERQLTVLTDSLFDAVNQLSALIYTPRGELQVDPELQIYIENFIAELDPENPRQDIDEFIDKLEQSFTIAENPEYHDVLSQLEEDLDNSSDAASAVLGLLPEILDISSQLGDQLSVLNGLDSYIQDPLVQAIAQEEAAKKRLDEAVPELKARISGMVGEINVAAGDMAGPSSVDLNTGTGLESILGNTIGSATANSPSLVTIYDNLRPIAVFFADRYDAGRVAEGMKVLYQYDDRQFYGEIQRKARMAESSSFAQSGDLDIFGDVASAGGFSSEPQLRVDMSIKGDNLSSLTLGFWIDAEIETAIASNALLLPAEAMRREVDQYYVFILNSENILERRDFQPGIQSDMYVEIVSGLREGDNVVLNPDSTYEDGMKVKDITNE